MSMPLLRDTTKVWQRHLFALALLLAWILFLYRETAMAVVSIWAKSETFTHGFLVPPIVAWLIWRQRGVVLAEKPRPGLWGLVPVFLVATFWLLGALAAVNSVTQLALAAMLVLCVPVVLGLTVTRAIVFPLGFLFFAVPIGEFVMPQLMEWTANFTVVALRLSGIPVYREGLQFVIPSGNWSVVEACSGVRYLIASLTVGTLFAYLNYQSSRRRLIFIVISILVPVVANWMRAYLIVMLGHLSGNKLAAGVDHLIYGWVFFGVVIMVMFMIGARWAEPEIAHKIVAPAREGSLSPGQTAPSPLILWLAVLAMAVVVAFPQAAQWAVDREVAGPPVLLAPKVLVGSWQDAGRPLTDWKPVYKNPSAEIHTSYVAEGQSVGVYVGYYRHQDYSRKLVSSDNTLVKSLDPRWAQVSAGHHVLDLGERQILARATEVRGLATPEQPNGERFVVWQLYWINGSITSSDYLAKAYSAFYRLTGRGDDSAVILLYASQDKAEGAQAALESFARTNFEAVEAVLAKTRDRR